MHSIVTSKALFSYVRKGTLRANSFWATVFFSAGPELNFPQFLRSIFIFFFARSFEDPHHAMQKGLRGSYKKLFLKSIFLTQKVVFWRLI